MSPPSPFAMAQWRRVSMLPLLLWSCLSAAFIGPVARRSTLLGLFSAAQQAAQALPGSPRLAGKYDDPEFPGCPREIVPQGARVLVRGTDGEGPSCQGKSWEAVGRRGRGNFFEHGPVALNSQGQLLPRAANETWATYAPVLYVDSPVGTGWSWARDQGFAKSQSDVARALARFLDIFAARHTGSRRLVLAGESYGGHYVPLLGNYLLQNPGPFQLEAVMVGDGLTDPAIQVLTKPQEAYAFGLVDETKLKEAQSLAQEAHALAQEAHWVEAAEKRSAMEDVVKNASEINPYDVRTTEQYDWLQERMQKFFEKKSNKDLLHIPENLTFGTSPQVKENLKADIMKSQKPHVESLLNAGVRVLLYQGQFDWKDGFVSNEAWIRTLSWEGTQQFLSSSRQLWRRTDQQLAGYWKSYENLEQVLVLGAGHLVPMNQPLSAVDLLLCFLKLEGRMTPTATPD